MEVVRWGICWGSVGAVGGPLGSIGGGMEAVAAFLEVGGGGNEKDPQPLKCMLLASFPIVIYYYILSNSFIFSQFSWLDPIRMLTC